MTQDNSPEKLRKPKVGYKNPPKEHQFKKGMSGNKKGRPKGSKNKVRGNEAVLNEFIIEEGNREFLVQDRGKSQSMPVAKIIVRTMANKGVKGDTSSAKTFVNLLKNAEAEELARLQRDVERATEYKRASYKYIKDRKLYGDDFEMPLPHPDHIQIDWETGEVSLSGPFDRETLKAHTDCTDIIAQIEVELQMYWQSLDGIAQDGDCGFSDYLKDEIKWHSHWLGKFRENIPEDDPLWIEYGPERKNAWIDYYYYYGPSPRDSSQRSRNSVSAENDFMEATGYSYEKVRTVKAILESADEFRRFMHSYLEWYMENDWSLRLMGDVHEMRDIELDKNLHKATLRRFSEEDAKDVSFSEFEWFNALETCAWEEQNQT